MKGVLHFKGVERTLTSFRLSHHKSTDISGYPSSLPKASFFEVSFLAQEGDDFFIQWMCGKNIAHGGVKGFWYDGKIVFYDETSDGQELYRYDLQYVMPVHFRLEYDHLNGMEIHLRLTALDRVYNHLLHTENFYGYFFEYAKPKERPKPMPKEEQRVRCYYTDLEDNPKAEVHIGDEIYLVIESEGIIGKTIDIELSDEYKDFEYQGEILENDILRDILIEEDYQKILLKIVSPQKEIDNNKQ